MHYPVSGATALQLLSVPPPRFFDQLRLAHTHDVEVFRLEQRYGIRLGKQAPSIVGQAFQLLQRFPALFDRREIPTPATAADRPEPAARRVEGNSPPQTEMFDGLVLRQLDVAVDTLRKHLPDRFGKAADGDVKRSAKIGSASETVASPK